MILKEVRALLPAWAACTLAIFASGWNVEPFKYLGVPAFFIGTAGLGAWAMGHEYANGTLASLLTVPVARRRLWTAKLAVIAPMLAALAMVGAWSTQLERGDRTFGAALFILPPIVSLFVAPWLTMVTRSPLAGAVFTFSALGGSLALGAWIGELRYGVANQVDVFRVEFLWWSLGCLSVVAAIMSWRTFATLEAPDGPGADVQLPFARRRTVAGTVTRRHPLLRLVAKEVRLQQLAIVIAVLWAVAYTLAEASGVRAARELSGADLGITILTVLSAFYSLVLPVVIGSLACAEERQFGTLDAQLLTPVRSSTQWIVKSLTALGLAELLALLIPLALARLFGDRVLIVGPRNTLTVEAHVLVLGMTSIGLYVSSLARSGMRALIGSVATIGAFAFYVERLVFFSSINRKLFVAVHATRAAHSHRGIVPVLSDAYRVVPLCLFVALVVALALPNFRDTDRRPARVAAHAAIVLASVMAYDIALTIIEALRF